MSDANFQHRTVFHEDCLRVMRGINSSSIHLIATDPPFNTNRDHHATPPDLVDRESIGFEDRWSWRALQDGALADLMQHRDSRLQELINVYDRIWGETMAAFITFLGVRALEMHRILRDDGTLYWHCDPTASHYIKPMLDAIFGRENFRDEIVWFKGSRGTRRLSRYQQEHETIFRYSKSDKYTWNQPIGRYRDKSLARYNKVDEHGKRYARILRTRADGSRYYGRTYPRGKYQGDVIDIPTLGATSKERMRHGFPTQKPQALYELIIGASSNPGDWVLDPFCGCATTLGAADKLERKWIGIDIWGGAVREVHKRLNNRMAKRVPMVPVRTDARETVFDALTTSNATKLADPSSGLDASKEKSIRELKEEKLGGRSFGQCFACEDWFSRGELTIDHDPPRSRGGRNTHEDTELMCEPCNREKGDEKTGASLRREKRRARRGSGGTSDPNQGEIDIDE